MNGLQEEAQWSTLINLVVQKDKLLHGLSILLVATAKKQQQKQNKLSETKSEGSSSNQKRLFWDVMNADLWEQIGFQQTHKKQFSLLFERLTVLKSWRSYLIIATGQESEERHDDALNEKEEKVDNRSGILVAWSTRIRFFSIDLFSRYLPR